ncbi:MAG TPA: hypothetical protein DD732_09725 [Rhizobiales bacterium]|jgi:putative FmdB family regulatory protein|nr:hypothetical protein [Hyphomicrobiales bacterium]
MPIYEFRCPTCEYEYDELADYGTLVPCSRCGEKKPHLKISLFKIASRPAVVPEPATAEADSHPGAVTFVNCTLRGREVGMRIGKGRRVRSRGLRVRGGKAGIVNEGSFDGPDTIFE